MKMHRHCSQKLVIVILQLLCFTAILAAINWAFFGSIKAPDDLGILSLRGSQTYDYSGYTKCQDDPAQPLYSGGILANPTFDQGLEGWSAFGGCTMEIRTQGGNKFLVARSRTASYQGPSQALHNLTQGTKYTLSAWLQISGGSSNSTFAKATLKTEDQTYTCGASIMARNGCWLFMKGGFVLNRNFGSATLYFEASDSTVEIWIDNVALQPFTDEEWQSHQELQVNGTRKRSVEINLIDRYGRCLPNMQLKINQSKSSFPFGSAIPASILDNEAYQAWFVKRFNAAVFENELKWYFTEPQQGAVSYTVPHRMLDFCNAYNISVRGHCVFWDDPTYVQWWVKNLSQQDLRSATDSRIHSLLGNFTGRFIGWDVNNEMLHYSFYEDRLGHNASIGFFQQVQELDPGTPLFLNEYNVIETCYDSKSTITQFVDKLGGIKAAGIVLEGVGLESHFSETQPNVAYMRSVLDQFGTLGAPVWLTEVDITNQIDNKSQATYLQAVLREAFSHPAVTGIMLWAGWHSNGCYRMCLTDNNFNNLPTGDVVDAFISEHKSIGIEGLTNEHGAFQFEGYLGVYNISVTYNNSYNLEQTVASSFSINSSTNKVIIQLNGVDCLDDTLEATVQTM